MDPSLLTEIGPDGLARESPVVALTEKIIAEEQLQLKRYIEENYSKIRDVERELANLTLELKLTAGPKKAALEHLRKKIELSTERIRIAKVKEDQARKVLEEASKAVQEEEAIKQKLCDDLNSLVQESTSTQFSRLEELKRRLEALNPIRPSHNDAPVAKSVQPAQSSTVVPSTASTPHPAESAGHRPENLLSSGNDRDATPPLNGQEQLPHIDGEGRGKKRSSNVGRGGRGIMILGKGRGTPGTGWTGAGFDVDGRA
ncbi:putative RAFL24-31-B07 [Cinnamomum micranthum f. kanehirae]|uniref:Putative RAFL24-31-B07 n=1 Tax=Cinnamomum micranthum f. kanehirae TaxID=337451 RepID=A0A3S3QRN5_9MAGN|nr:putative RAFL24-31-B07 [Cinnamomum micranthum f. kanehirae]